MRIATVARWLAVCCLLTVAACGAADDPPGVGETTAAPSSSSVTDTSTTSGRSPTTVSEPTSTGAPDADAKIRGSAVVTDDVGSASSSPMRHATLAITRLDQAAALWTAIDFTPPDSQLPYVSGLVEDASVFAHLIAVDEGRFGFDAPDGDYLVCLLDGTGPYILSGCGVATVAGPGEWAISRGEGGFEVSSG